MITLWLNHFCTDLYRRRSCLVFIFISIRIQQQLFYGVHLIVNSGHLLEDLSSVPVLHNELVSDVNPDLSGTALA